MLGSGHATWRSEEHPLRSTGPTFSSRHSQRVCAEKNRVSIYLCVFHPTQAGCTLGPRPHPSRVDTRSQQMHLISTSTATTKTTTTTTTTTTATATATRRDPPRKKLVSTRQKPFRVRHSKKNCPTRAPADFPPGWVGVGWRVVWERSGWERSGWRRSGRVLWPRRPAFSGQGFTKCPCVL